MLKRAMWWAAAVLTGAGPAAGQICRPSWATEFAPGDPTGVIYAQAIFDDGTGPKLYAGGAGNVWRWDGTSWVSVGTVAGGSTTAPAVYAMTVWDEDGAGPNPPRLFVGGDFGGVGGAPSQNIARYDGTSWSALGLGVTLSPSQFNLPMVRSLAAFNDGTGPALYVGGGFNRAGGSITANRIARWNGSSWSALGQGFTGGNSADNAVFSMSEFNGQLHVGGGFTQSGTSQITGAARWTGSAWQALGAGLTFGRPVRAMAVYNDGTGPKLWCGGEFAGSGSTSSFGIMRWDGSAWSPVPSSPFNYGVNGACYTLLPTAEGMYVGGWFTVAGNLQNAGGIARYSNGAWSSVGGGLVGSTSNVSGNFRTLIRHDDGRGPAVFAGGSYAIVGAASGPVAVSNLARWTGTQWTAVGQERRGMQGYAYVHKVLDAGDGPAMYIGGVSTIGTLNVAGGIAKWDGSAWSVLGPRPTGSSVSALTVFDDGAGPALYMAHDAVVNQQWQGAVSRWTGSAWVQVGDPFTSSGGSGGPGVLLVFDDGTGPTLWSFGNYDHVGAAPAAGEAKLVNGAWQPVDFIQLSGQLNGTGPYASDLRMFHGSLYMEGYFTSVNGVAAEGAARWQNGQWTAVGPPAVGQMINIFELDLGSGPTLVGSTNTFPNTMYRLENNAWVPLGPSSPVGFGPLAIFDDGSGPMLYTSGSGYAGSSLFCRLRNNAWEEVRPGFGTPGGATSMVVFNDRGAHRPALWMTGSFMSAGGVPAQSLTRYEGCAGACYANCDGSTAPPVVNPLDFACFLNHFAAGDAAANCDGSTVAPVLNVLDFMCYLNKAAVGCS